MFIRTERLFLRPGWPEDWEELHAAIADEAIVRNLSRVPWPYTPEDARDFIAQPQERLLPRFLVTLPGSRGTRLIGGCGLHRDDGAVSLGYWLDRSHWGMGYATEAAGAVLRLARTLGHRRIVAGHALDNPSSGRVLQKVGFRATGRVAAKDSRSRGYPVRVALYEVDLGDSGDNDGSGGDEPMIGRVRSAA
jgi:RimJ/RimL family protein N-acetyltransferase